MSSVVTPVSWLKRSANAQVYVDGATLINHVLPQAGGIQVDAQSSLNSKPHVEFSAVSVATRYSFIPHNSLVYLHRALAVVPNNC